MALRQYDKAMSDFDKAIELDPKDAFHLSCRARIHAALRQYDKACTDYAKALALDPADPFVPMCLFAARQRAGQDGKKEFAAHVKKHVKDPEKWPAPAAMMLLGKITPKQCLAAAAGGDEQARDDRLCEAHYYIGMHHLISARPDQAKKSFKRCLATGIVDFIEYGQAQQELQRMKKP